MVSSHLGLKKGATLPRALHALCGWSFVDDVFDPVLLDVATCFVGPVVLIGYFYTREFDLTFEVDGALGRLVKGQFIPVVK